MGSRQHFEFPASGVRLALLFAVGALLLPLLGGCAVDYVDEAGNRRIVGLVDLTLHPAGGPGAGTVVDLTTVGIAIADTGQGGHVVLGYSRERTAVLRNDALVAGNPLAATDAPTANGSRGN